jgi:hypothetical protein
LRVAALTALVGAGVAFATVRKPAHAESATATAFVEA